jgi:hypothetical protein
MKKTVLIIVSIVLVLILSTVTYFYVWGGKPQIENFVEVSDDYEIIAQLALNTYGELSPEAEYIIIDFYDYNFKHNNSNLPLTEEQQNAVLIASENFDYLRVCKDAVFFCEDETGYYGLVYSKHPLIALYKSELPKDGREYHRINSRWYEWGVWGI